MLRLQSAALGLAALSLHSAFAQSADDLDRLSIEQLGNIEVTSVFRRPAPLAHTPAAAYVITRDEIRRSGAVSFAEALRLAPNLQVARLDASSHAISARGFNTYQAANKLLVLIDGRGVYTPLHAGVYWDQQQLPLSDVERIEVISGPGGTMWGANAVNGVVNVITRSALHRTEPLLIVRGGDTDSSAYAGMGHKFGESGALRDYGMAFERGATLMANGVEANDDWKGIQGGFRSDWQWRSSALTVQGDAFENSFDIGGIRGGNVLSRWTVSPNARSNVMVQAYYDKVRRDSNLVYDSLETFDFHAQQSLAVGSGQQIVWGGGHRVTHDRLVNGLNFFVLRPESETVQLSNLFAQDTIALNAAVTFTAGLKLEYSSYTGLEVMPSVRLEWLASDDAMWWSSVSRAARTPSRIDRELTAPSLLEQARDFDSEIVIAYEMGHRYQLGGRANLSVSVFYNDYDDLRMLVRAPSGLLKFDNAMRGYTYGAELWSNVQVLDGWRLSPGINLLEKRLKYGANAQTFVLDQHAGNDPRRQYFLRSSLDLPHRFEFDVALRAIDDLPNPRVDHYVELDARLGWRVSRNFEASLAGFNLLHDRHHETGAAAARREIPRSAHLEVKWEF